ncbi:small integral membrane protein 29-like isoform X2 [Callorhinchus milii]|uniref:small integral membrane protein 29-like isoform X2 n=1 Tax=Callorhinchus milii TaxID=7868 RepID=UPI0004574517|nr:small integral membrane protein 29-like isoform X2 [Callorhinchus milii]XP_007903143.1 small integral membrane protein 29-like isoform X2 [Callorhinchus milii]|eukprot:gi/632973412/ref/XP_007903142.1/ PREDICTED: uncharacterized protein C3orf18-like isoform X2 [Callorhinchus milii]
MPNQTATTPPDGTRRGSIIGFMLIPVTIIVGIAIAVFVIIYIRKRRRLEMLRNKLVPIYSYDPSENRNDVEEESLDLNGEAKNSHDPPEEKESKQNDNCLNSSDSSSVL